MSIRSTFTAASIRGWQASVAIKGEISSPISGTNFGRCVRLSYDGRYLVVGNSSSSGINTVAVYTRGSTPNSWTLQSYLNTSDVVTAYGYSVDITSDGTTAVVSAPGTKTYIFKRSGTTWSNYSSLFDPTMASFGGSISISGDGTYITAGSKYSTSFNMYNSVTGSLLSTGLYTATYTEQDFTGTRFVVFNDAASFNLYIVVRSGSTWTNEFTKGPGGLIYRAAAINSTGTYVCYSIGNTVFVYTRSGSTWTQQASFQPTVPIAGENFGISLAINTAADTIAVGTGLNSTSTSSTAYVFTRSGTTWTQSAILSSNSGAIESFGIGISIDQNTGSYIAVGTDKAKAYVFHKISAGVWTTNNA